MVVLVVVVAQSSIQSYQAKRRRRPRRRRRNYDDTPCAAPLLFFTKSAMNFKLGSTWIITIRHHPCLQLSQEYLCKKSLQNALTPLVHIQPTKESHLWCNHLGPHRSCESISIGQIFYYGKRILEVFWHGYTLRKLYGCMFLSLDKAPSHLLAVVDILVFFFQALLKQMTRPQRSLDFREQEKNKKCRHNLFFRGKSFGLEKSQWWFSLWLMPS